MIFVRYLTVSFLILILLGGVAACALKPDRYFEPEASPEGARLFELHCAACHGRGGKGGVGVPLALPDFLDSVTPRYLELTIRIGRPGRVMPAFWELKDEEIAAIIDYILGEEPRRPEYPKESVKGDPVRGGELFAENCAKCHGADGQGSRGTGVTFSRPRDLPILAPALNNPGFLLAAADEFVKHTLMVGREGTPMSSFLKQGLSERDIDDIVSFIRSFQRKLSVRSVTLKEVSKPIMARRSPYSFDETIKRVKGSIAHQGRGFMVVREQDLERGFVTEGAEEERQHMIYFSGFKYLNDALAADPRMGLFLPSRVTVVQRGDSVLVMAIDPRQQSALFNNTSLNDVSEYMFRVYHAILEEVVR